MEEMPSERFATVYCFAWTNIWLCDTLAERRSFDALLFHSFFNQSKSLQTNENAGAATKLNCLEKVSGLIL